MSLVRSAQAWATLADRDHVVPEDVQAVFVAVAGHRLVGNGVSGEVAAQRLLAEVDVIQ